MLAHLKKNIQLAQVGEFSTIVCTSSSDTSILLAIFELWIAKNGFEVILPPAGQFATRHPSKPHVGVARICSVNYICLGSEALYMI